MCMEMCVRAVYVYTHMYVSYIHVFDLKIYMTRKQRGNCLEREKGAAGVEEG